MGLYRKSVLRIVSVFLLIVLSFGTAMPVYATAEATTEESVGTSLYSVTTALTAFANNVVGANTNDKHSNDIDVAKDHRLWELSNAMQSLGFGRVNVGDAGAIVGYGDKTKGFVAYISANETRSVTTSSYGAYMNVGDDGKSYAYVRYGRLLNELGVDETGNPAQPDAGRSVGGRIVQCGYVLSTFVPTMFDVCLDIMRLLNPFRFLVNQTAVSGTVTSADGSVSTGNTITDPFTGNVETVTIGTGTVTAQDIPGVDEYSTSGAESGLYRVSQMTTDIYVRLRQIGLVLILPLMLAFMIGGFLLSYRRGISGGWSRRFLMYAIRFVFIVIGIPLLGVLYTSTLDEIKSVTLKQSPSARIIAASFVDFENWVKTSRLEPPKTQGSSSFELKSEGVDLNGVTSTDSTEAQGHASGDSWRTVRELIYQINYSTNLYAIGSDSGLGVTAGGDEIDTNAGMWDTNGQYLSMGSDSGNRKAIFSRMNTLLNTFSNGSFYTASAWESNVNSELTANYASDLGSTDSTDGASSNKNTIYQMYFDTDEVDDWMNRSMDDNAAIFGDVNNGSDGPEEARWAFAPWNIFSNGTDLGVATLPTVASSDVVYKAGSQSFVSGRPRDAIDPAAITGLSTVSMYNYLASAFNASNISVYSAANTTSEYTRLQHYSVNLAGSGFMRTLFLFNCAICLGIFAVIGFVYCLGMVFHVLKTGLSMIMTIPGAMLGLVGSAVQIVVYVCTMIIELLCTVFLYQFVGDLVIVFASAVETPIRDGIANIQANAVAGGIFANGMSDWMLGSLADSHFCFVAGLFVVVALLFGLSFVVIKLRRPVLVVWAYVWLKIARFMTVPAMRPTFDAWAARQKTLYIWDALNDDLDRVRNVGLDLVHDVNEEGGAVVC